MVALNLSELMDEIERQGVTAKQMKTAESMTWFADTIGKNFGGKTRDKQAKQRLGSDLMKAEPVYLTEQFQMGRMMMWFYNPKYRDTLPYWDAFPCAFPFADARSVSGEDSFYAINLHYLHPRARAELMEALYKTETNTRFSEGKRLQLSYELLKSASEYRAFKPALKQYLITHVRSRFMAVPYEAWPIAAMLPMAQFQKASAAKVWNDSYRKLR